MLWNMECKQLLRTPIRTLAFCLALAAVMGLLGITMGLQFASAKVYNSIDQNYSTVGVIHAVPDKQLSSGERQQMQKKVNALKQALNKGEIQADSLLSIERHAWLAAYTAFETPTSAGALESEYSYKLDIPNNMGMFAVTCKSADLSGVVSGGAGGKKTNVYACWFDVNEVVALHPDLGQPKQIYMNTKLSPDGKNSMFVPGRTYLVWGYYERTSDTVGTLQTVIDFKNTSSKQAVADYWETDGMLYINLPNDRNPLEKLAMAGEYTGSVSEYLARDVQGCWSVARKVVDVGIHTVRLVTANTVKGFVAFVENDAEIVEGADFTEEDIAAGNRVVMVSETFAARNGLHVGDTIDLSCYGVSYTNTLNGITTGKSDDSGMYPFGTYHGMPNDFNSVAGGKGAASQLDGDYKIVAIYRTNDWADDLQTLHTNTFIIPSACYIEKIGFNAISNDMLYGFVVANGRIDELDAELERLGLEAQIDYYDGGYSLVEPNIRAIRDSASFLNKIVIGLWCIVTFMVIAFYVLIQVPAGRVKFRLGTGKKAIWGQMTFSTVLLVIVSGVVGCVGSVFLYDKALYWMTHADFTAFNTSFSSQSANTEVLEHLLSSLTQSTQFFVTVTVIQVAVLAVVGTVLGAVIALRRTGFRQ